MEDVIFKDGTERVFWGTALFSSLCTGANALVAISRADNALEAWRLRSVAINGELDTPGV